MPEISRFYGNIIRMYWERGAQHHTPHIHVYYQGHEASYSIVDPIECLAGSLPRKAHRLVVAWIEIHQEALQENWQLMLNQDSPHKIPPLR